MPPEQGDLVVHRQGRGPAGDAGPARRLRGAHLGRTVLGNSALCLASFLMITVWADGAFRVAGPVTNLFARVFLGAGGRGHGSRRSPDAEAADPRPGDAARSAPVPGRSRRPAGVPGRPARGRQEPGACRVQQRIPSRADGYAPPHARDVAAEAARRPKPETGGPTARSSRPLRRPPCVGADKDGAPGLGSHGRKPLAVIVSRSRGWRRADLHRPRRDRTRLSRRG